MATLGGSVVTEELVDKEAEAETLAEAVETDVDPEVVVVECWRVVPGPVGGGICGPAKDVNLFKINRMIYCLLRVEVLVVVTAPMGIVS